MRKQYNAMVVFFPHVTDVYDNGYDASRVKIEDQYRSTYLLFVVSKDADYMYMNILYICRYRVIKWIRPDQFSTAA